MDTLHPLTEDVITPDFIYELHHIVSVLLAVFPGGVLIQRYFNVQVHVFYCPRATSMVVRMTQRRRGKYHLIF